MLFPLPFYYKAAASSILLRQIGFTQLAKLSYTSSSNSNSNSTSKDTHPSCLAEDTEEEEKVVGVEEVTTGKKTCFYF